MKGLIKNNAIDIFEGTKKVIIFDIIAAIICSVLSNSASDINREAFLVVFSIIPIIFYGLCSVIRITGERYNGWLKYESIFPINRKDIITARYISDLISILFGLFMVIINLSIFSLINNNVSLKSSVTISLVAVLFGVLVVLWFFAIIQTGYVFCDLKDAGVAFIIASFSFGLALGSVNMFYEKNISEMNPVILYSAVFVFMIVIYIISYKINIKKITKVDIK